MTTLSTDEVRHVAELAKLQLTEAEVELFASQLSAVLDYAAHLQEVDLARFSNRHCPAVAQRDACRRSTPQPTAGASVGQRPRTERWPFQSSRHTRWQPVR